MSFFEQSRYYLNNILPDIILYNLDQINTFLEQWWWIFGLFSLFFFFFMLNIFRQKVYLESKNLEFNTFLQKLSLQTQIKDVEKILLESAKLVNAKYLALYELRGETYILIETNTSTNTDVAAPFRIGKKDIDDFQKSGNYKVYSIANSSQNQMMMFFSFYTFDLKPYYGYFDIMLTYYEQVSKSFNFKGGETQSSLGKSTSSSLMKLQMDKNQFFKFFISLVIKITKAEGVKLFTKEGALVFEQVPSENASLKKVFFIRNTPYKLEFYDTKPLKQETITQVGSFLDMAGGFLVNTDYESETIKNYLSFLRFTNDAIELENPYYKNHSLIVQTISVEIAKSLFLSEKEIDTIQLGSYLHDIGMVGDLLVAIDKEELEEQDMNLIKEHPLIGGIIVEPICHLYPIENIIKYHHERFDGKGYPFGLKESQIPLDAQIVSLGEFYVGVTSDRSYKEGKTHEEAVEIIKDLSKKMFNAVVVDAFLDIEKSLKTKIMKIKAKKD